MAATRYRLTPGDTLSVPITNEVFVAYEVNVPGKVVYVALVTAVAALWVTVSAP